jgi:hypothetical protein
MPNGFPAQHDFGNAFLKISTAGGLAVADYFASFDTVAQSSADNDLGSGGTVRFAQRTYTSSQAGSNRDQFGTGNKFITPTIADGRVYVGTTNGVVVFGLLPLSH